MTSIQAALQGQLGRQPFLPALLKRPPARPRLTVVAVALSLFAGILVLRLAVPSISDPVLFLNVIPIALLSLEVGRKGGIAGATIGVLTIGLWCLFEHVELSAIGYFTRVGTFFLVGALAGYLTDHLRHARQAQQLLLDLAPESTLAIDLDGHVTIANSAAARLFGRAAHELSGLPVDQLVPDFFRALRQSLRERSTLEEAIRLTACCKDGREAGVRATVDALVSDAGVLLVRLRPAEAGAESVPD